MDDDPSVGTPEQLAFIREETRFELGLLHDRVNALLSAEAFLTIAYTGAMSNGAPWGARFSEVVSPILAVLGLLLALLAWPGIDATAKIVLGWSERQIEMVERNPDLTTSVWAMAIRQRGGRSADPTQWRSMLFFRTVPGLFALVWAVLTVVALVLHR